MTMVDLQGEEGKGQVGGGSRAKGRGKWESREKEMMVLAHTLVYLKSWTAYVSPPSALCTHPLPPPSAHTTPPSLCTHHSPSLCTHTHSREWLYLLSHEMFNPYYGLFEYSAR